MNQKKRRIIEEDEELDDLDLEELEDIYNDLVENDEEENDDAIIGRLLAQTLKEAEQLK